MSRHILVLVIAVCAVARFAPMASVEASELSGKVQIQFVEERMMEEWYPDEAMAQLVLQRPVGEHVDLVTVDGKEISLMPHGEDTFVDLWLDTVPAVCRIGSPAGGSEKFVARPGYCYVCRVTGHVAESTPVSPAGQVQVQEVSTKISGDINQIRNSFNEEQQHFDSLQHQVNVLHADRIDLGEKIARIKRERQTLTQDKAKLLAVRDNLSILNSDGIIGPISAVRDATESQLKSVIAALRSNGKELAPLQPQLDRKNQEAEALEQQLTESHTELESLRKQERVLRRAMPTE